MLLKEKGYWRKLLGLKGHFYYYEAETSKGPSIWKTPAFWTAVIAATSTVSTAIFAYQNYQQSARSYISTHRADLDVGSLMLGRDGFYSIYIRNDGDSPARNLRITITAFSSERPHPRLSFDELVYLGKIAGHSAAIVRTATHTDTVRQLATTRHHGLLSVQFDNQVGDPQDGFQYCADYSPEDDLLALTDCGLRPRRQSLPPQQQHNGE